METVLVLDVAATEGGALSILQEYYDRLREDTRANFVFCLSTPQLEETDHLRVRRFPWVKRSWLHRLWFEHVTLPRLMKEEGITRVFSLQNTAVTGAKVPQTIYLHQPLPFCGIRFSLRENPLFWVYQHLLAPRILRGLRVAEQVIVQTEWMKSAACEKAGISPDKVVLEAPKVNVAVTETFDAAAWKRTFFYPASPLSYKNHELIFRAVERLVAEGVQDFCVQLTLRADQLPQLANYPAAQPHVELLGQIPREEVMRRYARAVLLFPSYVETFGLPLLEARLTDAPVIASDCPFSNEILAGYEKASFFDPFSAEQLALRMRAVLEGEV